MRGVVLAAVFGWAFVQYWHVFVALALICVALYYTLRLPLPSQPNDALRDFLSGLRPVAHRGDSIEAPENTLAAIARAGESGVACGVELDVQVTADDTCVICHDTTVDRTTDGRGPVRGFKLQDLRQLCAAYHHPRRDLYRRETIPTLDEAVSEAARHKMSVFLDVKNNSPAALRVIIKSIVQLVSSHNLYHCVVVCSFYPHILWMIRRADPEIKTGLTYIEHPLTRNEDGSLRRGRLLHRITYAADVVLRWCVHTWLPRFLGVSFLLFHKDVVSRESVRAWATPALCWGGYALPVAVWTVNSESEKRFFAEAFTPPLPIMTDDVMSSAALISPEMLAAQAVAAQAAQMASATHAHQQTLQSDDTPPASPQHRDLQSPTEPLPPSTGLNRHQQTHLFARPSPSPQHHVAASLNAGGDAGDGGFEYLQSPMQRRGGPGGGMPMATPSPGLAALGRSPFGGGGLGDGQVRVLSSTSPTGRDDYEAGR